MKPADILIALLVAVIWGLAFVASRIALDEFSPELMTAMRFVGPLTSIGAPGPSGPGGGGPPPGAGPGAGGPPPGFLSGSENREGRRDGLRITTIAGRGRSPVMK